MTVYNAPKVAAGVQPRALPQGFGVSVISIQSQTTQLVPNDTINMVQIQADPSLGPNGGPVVQNVTLDCDALDSGTTLTLSVGDSVNANRYFSASTVARAGGYVQPTLGGILGYAPFGGAFFSTYTTVSNATYTVVVKAVASATTWANGNIRLMFEYTYDA